MVKKLWVRRPFPNCIIWDVAEAVVLVVALFAAFEVAKEGYDDGYDYRDQK
jgi:hypothetical protein